MNADEVSIAIALAVRSSYNQANIIKIPLADGGEGSLDLVDKYMKGQRISSNVNGPTGEPIKAEWLWFEDKKIAFVEMAKASGLELLEVDTLNINLTSTIGTGQLIASAISYGAKEVWLGLGGSATNDGGAGMLSALGIRFYDKQGIEFRPDSASLIRVFDIDISAFNRIVNGILFKAIVDVRSPLLGAEGATYTYALQKGASKDELDALEEGMRHWCSVLSDIKGEDIGGIVGLGAAGGTASSFYALMNSKIVSGIDILFDISGLDEKIKTSELIITGEGSLDEQSINDKLVAGVYRECVKHNKQIVIICGKINQEEKVRSFFKDAEIIVLGSNIEQIRDIAYVHKLIINKLITYFNQSKST
jgi:glycerate kinase